MQFAGPLGDKIGRKKILLAVAFLCTFALPLPMPFRMKPYIFRMVGGLAFGAALILAPT